MSAAGSSRGPDGLAPLTPGPSPELRPQAPLRTVLRLWPWVWQEWKLHPLRQSLALLAVLLGVALAWSVHVVNSSALAEFGAAVRGANGDPDLSLRGQRSGFDEAWLDRLQADPAVALASPVVEFDTYARVGEARVAVHVVGLDVLAAAPLAPALVPAPRAGSPGDAGEPGAAWTLLDPGQVHANAAALRALGIGQARVAIELRSGEHWQRFRLAGDVAAPGAPLLVMDIAGAQAAFGLLGRLTRIDLRLADGADRAALLQRLGLPDEHAGLALVDGEQQAQRVSNLSRAYRVNLTVLALVALFVGSFLVFAVVALAVAQRTPGLALLGVLGLTARERRWLVLAENLLLGALGSALGLALGTALAAGVLRWLGADLGAGYFQALPGAPPPLQLEAGWALLFFALGIASALAGAWVPARHAEGLQPALALKGFGEATQAAGSRLRRAAPLALLLLAGLLALLPPWGDLPLAAYASVAAALTGGVLLVPGMVQALLALWPRPRQVLGLLALQRARAQRHLATAAVAGVVSSLALGVALTVMVASFREGVTQWLEQVLPADLYARSAGNSALAEQAWFDAAALERVRAVSGVARAAAARVRALQLEATQPAVALVARPLGQAEGDVARQLPLREAALPRSALQPGEIAAYVSEAMVARYGLQPGSRFELPLPAPAPAAGGATSVPQAARVLGVWRDYARAFGTVAIDLADYQARSGDRHYTDLALWLDPGADAGQVQQAVRAAMGDPALLDFASAGELRRISLRIFDRSFAVTRYLQVLAVAIGLAGIAASFSAQVMARRKEFGLLAHLGFTRGQVLRLVAAEAGVWMAAGVALGVALGLIVSMVLVWVVNPQSFHWSMPLQVPPGPLAALAALVLASGVLTATASARGATRRQAVLAVKEDW